MSQDILSRATRELKERCDTPARAPRSRDGGPSPAETRARVMMSLHRNERRRMATVYVLLPAAAVLVASTAWAAANGHLPAVFHSIGESLGVMEPAGPPLPPQAPVARAPRVEPSAQPQESTPQEVAPPIVASQEQQSSPPVEAAREGSAVASIPPAPALSAPAPVIAIAPPPVKRSAPAPKVAPHAVEATRPAETGAINAPPPAAAAPQSAPSAPGASTRPASGGPRDEGDVLYEAAHRSHFVDRNWPAALQSWDRYLAASPRGRFVPEARYNRAIVLLRLDRRDEAVRELSPFADGAFGGYRQEEARRLIEATKSK